MTCARRILTLVLLLTASCVRLGFETRGSTDLHSADGADVLSRDVVPPDRRDVVTLPDHRPDAARRDGPRLDARKPDAPAPDAARRDGHLDARKPDLSAPDGGGGPLVPLWCKRFGGAGNEVGQWVATDGAGNVYIAGTFEGSVDFGAGVVTSVGGTDVYLASYTPSGVHRWSQAIGSSSADTVSGIGVDAAGNVYVGGTLKGNATYGGGTLNWSGSSDLFVASYTAAGAPRWGKAFGDTGYQATTGLSVDAAGNVYLNGSYDGKIVFGGGTTVTAVEGYDAFAASLTSAGGPRWATSWNQGSSVWYDYGDSITNDSTGKAYVAWHSNNTSQLYLVGLDTSGAQLWTKSSYNGGAVRGMASGANAMYAVGSLSGSLSFGTALTPVGGVDAFVVSLDGAGAHRWSKRWGGAGEDQWRNVAVDAGGDLHLVGYFTGTVDFGGGPMTSAGGTDWVVAKVSGATGAHLLSGRLGGSGADAGLGLALGGSSNLYVTGSFEGSVSCAGSLTSAGLTDVLLVKLPL